MKRSRITTPLMALGVLLVALWLTRQWLIAKFPPSTTECMRHIRQIGQTLQLYLNEHGHVYPSSLKQASDLYLDSPPVCPESADEPAHPVGDEFGYLYFAGGRRKDQVGRDEIVAIDSQPRHDGGGQVLCGDGHTFWAEGDEFQKYLTRRATSIIPETTAPSTTESK